MGWQAGFEAWTQSGHYQIDGLYSNYGLLLKGTTDLAYSGIWIGGSGNGDVTANAYVANITFAASMPLFAYSSPGAVAQFVCRNNGDGTWTVQLQSLYAQTVTWYVFDATPQYVGAGFGTQVFDGAGKLVFDARTPYPRVLAMLNGRIAMGSDGYGQYAFPGEYNTPYNYDAQKLAVGAVLTPTTTLSGARKDEGNWSGILGVGGWSTGVGVVVQSFYHWRFGPKAPSPPNYNYDFGSSLRWGALVLDVSLL
ncbi:hypothetical protein [Pandoraea commovens]|uniref:Uncharacterized protein n=1 Tax=Pandoraea commovens TaxID=2508289 RepID=A0ABY5QJD3_9BURK|nr:hypothetical protein [Pandoraea commovens]UVA80478.1 hypothetical protein NTU39_05495 [Pandoraea commovens]